MTGLWHCVTLDVTNGAFHFLIRLPGTSIKNHIAISPLQSLSPHLWSKYSIGTFKQCWQCFCLIVRYIRVNSLAAHYMSDLILFKLKYVVNFTVLFIYIYVCVMSGKILTERKPSSWKKVIIVYFEYLFKNSFPNDFMYNSTTSFR